MIILNSKNHNNNEKTNKNTYLLHASYEETTLSSI